MKKIINVLAVIAAVTLPGCTKEHSPEVNPDGEMVLVHLNLGGEIDVEETPLTRAFTSDDLIGVQVYQGSDYYAYGLFDDVSKMKIYLHSGKTYKFVCSVVKNGKNIVGKRESIWISSSTRRDYWLPYSASDDERKFYFPNELYSLPFLISGDSGMDLNNEFIYTSGGHFYPCLEYGWLDTGNDYNKYPQADRFFGEVNGFTAVGSGSVSIPLRRVGFGLSLSVSGITDGSVSVTISNSYRTFVNNTGITQDTQFGTTTWSFFDLKSAWQYADNYTENFTVGVIWNRGVGVTQNLGTKTVQFKRNAVNHVKINLSSSTKASGVAVSLEEPVITNETYSIGN